MEYLLPSEVARLVYGYLECEKCLEAANVFLKTSEHLRECYQISLLHRKFSTNVMNYTLYKCLDQFCAIHRLVQDRIESMQANHISSYELVDQVAYLIDVGCKGHSTVMFNITVPVQEDTNKTIDETAVAKRKNTPSTPSNEASDSMSYSISIEGSPTRPTLSVTNTTPTPRTPGKQSAPSSSPVTHIQMPPVPETTNLECLPGNYNPLLKPRAKRKEVISVPQVSSVNMGDEICPQNRTGLISNTIIRDPAMEEYGRKSKQKKEKANSGGEELESIIKSIVTQTKSDPFFQNFLDEFFDGARDSDCSPTKPSQVASMSKRKSVDIDKEADACRTKFEEHKDASSKTEVNAKSVSASETNFVETGNSSTEDCDRNDHQHSDDTVSASNETIAVKVNPSNKNPQSQTAAKPSRSMKSSGKKPVTVAHHQTFSVMKTEKANLTTQNLSSSSIVVLPSSLAKSTSTETATGTVPQLQRMVTLPNHPTTSLMKPISVQSNSMNPTPNPADSNTLILPAPLKPKTVLISEDPLRPPKHGIYTKDVRPCIMVANQLLPSPKNIAPKNTPVTPPEKETLSILPPKKRKENSQRKKPSKGVEKKLDPVDALKSENVEVNRKVPEDRTTNFTESQKLKTLLTNSISNAGATWEETTVVSNTPVKKDFNEKPPDIPIEHQSERESKSDHEEHLRIPLGSIVGTNSNCSMHSDLPDEIERKAPDLVCSISLPKQSCETIESSPQTPLDDCKLSPQACESPVVTLSNSLSGMAAYEANEVDNKHEDNSEVAEVLSTEGDSKGTNSACSSVDADVSCTIPPPRKGPDRGCSVGEDDAASTDRTSAINISPYNDSAVSDFDCKDDKIASLCVKSSAEGEIVPKSSADILRISENMNPDLKEPVQEAEVAATTIEDINLKRCTRDDKSIIPNNICLPSTSTNLLTSLKNCSIASQSSAMNPKVSLNVPKCSPINACKITQINLSDNKINSEFKKLISPVIQNRTKKQSLSTPRNKKSHVRALDFCTPPNRDGSLRTALTSPKQTLASIITKRNDRFKNVCRSQLFETPSTNRTFSCKVTNEEISQTPTLLQKVDANLPTFCSKSIVKTHERKLSPIVESQIDKTSSVCKSNSVNVTPEALLATMDPQELESLRKAIKNQLDPPQSEETNVTQHNLTQIQGQISSKKSSLKKNKVHQSLSERDTNINGCIESIKTKASAFSTDADSKVVSERALVKKSDGNVAISLSDSSKDDLERLKHSNVRHNQLKSPHKLKGSENINLESAKIKDEKLGEPNFSNNSVRHEQLNSINKSHLLSAKMPILHKALCKSKDWPNEQKYIGSCDVPQKNQSRNTDGEIAIPKNEIVQSYSEKHETKDKECVQLFALSSQQCKERSSINDRLKGHAGNVDNGNELANISKDYDGNVTAGSSSCDDNLFIVTSEEQEILTAANESRVKSSADSIKFEFVDCSNLDPPHSKVIEGGLKTSSTDAKGAAYDYTPPDDVKVHQPFIAEKIPPCNRTDDTVSSNALNFPINLAPTKTDGAPNQFSFCVTHDESKEKHINFNASDFKKKEEYLQNFLFALEVEIDGGVNVCTMKVSEEETLLCIPSKLEQFNPASQSKIIKKKVYHQSKGDKSKVVIPKKSDQAKSCTSLLSSEPHSRNSSTSCRSSNEPERKKRLKDNKKDDRSLRDCIDQSDDRLCPKSSKNSSGYRSVTNIHEDTTDKTSRRGSKRPAKESISTNSCSKSLDVSKPHNAPSKLGASDKIDRHDSANIASPSSPRESVSPPPVKKPKILLHHRNKQYKVTNGIKTHLQEHPHRHTESPREREKDYHDHGSSHSSKSKPRTSHQSQSEENIRQCKSKKQEGSESMKKRSQSSLIRTDSVSNNRKILEEFLKMHDLKNNHCASSARKEE